MPASHWASYGEGGIWTLAPLLTTYSLSRGAPSASLGTSPKCLNHKLILFQFKQETNHHIRFPVKRRGWDSNPCALADKRFSRPPRYDHFDTSPGCFAHVLPNRAKSILAPEIVFVNAIFQVFPTICKFLITSQPLQTWQQQFPYAKLPSSGGPPPKSSCFYPHPSKNMLRYKGCCLRRNI